MQGLSLLFSMLLANPGTKPNSFRELSTSFQTVYEVLQEAHTSKEYSSTIKFSFVPPTSFPEKLSSQESDVFLQVSSQFGLNRPVAVYLPGLDCAGISGFQQFDDISARFEFWRMTVETSDRSSLSELVNAVVQFIEDVSHHGTREVTLIGESFGGLLAPIVALKLQNRKSGTLRGLVLVNPATSFDYANWDILGPLLTTLEIFGASDGATPYAVIGGLALSTLIPDSTQATAIVQSILGIPIKSASSILDLLDAVNGGFGLLGKRLPPSLVRHRVTNWLMVGSQILTESRLSSINVPTLVVVGEDDNFLPSKHEAERLSRILPNLQKMVVKGSGHFVLDSRINLTEAIIYSNIDPFKITSSKNYDPITDWKPPDDEEYKETAERFVVPLQQLTSPVFFSTDANGKRWKGLGKIESHANPIVFVANHQLFGLDLGMIILQLKEDRDIVARGLAHPVIFSNQNVQDSQPTSPGIVDKPSPRGASDPRTFRKFGAVKVTPRNYYRLLQTGQNVLLFPGGVREVFHGKDEAYKLFWPDTADFVRTAIRFNATIVTISAVGAADSVKILLDGPEMTKLPFGIGESILERSANITAARFDQKNNEELFVPPLFVPKLPPARHYFMFGKPFTTAHMDHRNSEQCSRLFREVKDELERGFYDLLRARERDPFKDDVQRLLYEQLSGKSAPTFSVDALNEGYTYMHGTSK